MDSVTNELMYEVLKDIRKAISHQGDSLREISDGLLRVREDLHSLTGHHLRLERQVAEIDLKIDRLNIRTGLVDA